MNLDEVYMQEALKLAEKAEYYGEVPVGAVAVYKDRIIGKGFNQCIVQSDPSAHAEMIAIRQAAESLKNYRIPDVTLYVTLEPCAMCTGLLVHARICRLVFGAKDSKTGTCGTLVDLPAELKMNHRFEVTGGVLEEQCSRLLSNFFANRRRQKKQFKN